MPKKKKPAGTRYHPRAKQALADVEKVHKAHKKLELELSNLKKKLKRDMMTWQWRA